MALLLVVSAALLLVVGGGVGSLDSLALLSGLIPALFLVFNLKKLLSGYYKSSDREKAIKMNEINTGSPKKHQFLKIKIFLKNTPNLLCDNKEGKKVTC